jgi:LysM repeat protein
VHTRYILNSILIGLVLVLLTQAAPAKAQAAPAIAQAGSAGELISQVNAYRAANGLEPYATDGGLMSLAQSHSEYQASIRTCTHQRENGGGPESDGIAAENIACGNGLTVEGAVYGQWTDQVHLATMLGPTTGSAGAGVAVVDNMVYYTLAVKLGSGSFNYSPPAKKNDAQNVSQVESANQPFSQIITTTPNGDGSIAHIVKYGETLIDIANAYGLPLADLISINQLSPTSPQIFEKQVLIIRVAFTQTPFMTATYTPRPPTRTPMPSRTPRPTRTPVVEHTPLPTHTPTAEPLLKVPKIEELGPARPVMAYTFIGIGALGLILVLLTAFLPRKK